MEIVEDALSRAWSGVPSTIVSSARLPKADLDLIDALVEGNVFKIRSEGIAFFAHRGIEASRGFPDKAMVSRADGVAPCWCAYLFKFLS